MGAHEKADAELTRFEADIARRRALELVAELDTIPLSYTPDLARWAWQASVILAELARG